MGLSLCESLSVVFLHTESSIAVKMPFGLGELPKEYNKAVHGPYDPAMFYGKKDTPLSQVKLGELPGWFSRRSMNPIDWSRAVSRAYWRWNHKYMQPKYCGLTPLIQLAFGSMAFFYVLNYGKFKNHRNYKYHW